MTEAWSRITVWTASVNSKASGRNYRWKDRGLDGWAQHSWSSRRSVAYNLFDCSCRLRVSRGRRLPDSHVVVMVVRCSLVENIISIPFRPDPPTGLTGSKSTITRPIAHRHTIPIELPFLLFLPEASAVHSVQSCASVMDTIISTSLMARD